MSRLGPALRSQFMKGVKDVLKTTAKETMKSAAEELMTKRPRVGTVGDISVSPPSSPASFSVAAASAPRPPPVQFPAVCVCKYEPSAPDLGSGNRSYICSGCSRSGMGEYKTIVEGREFAKLKGGRKTRHMRRSRRSRLHLTKRMRVRHNSKNGRSRR
uniref:Uncharacterized protein n=1 Tax=viral metagenome TaxID=1070528 RepID=A0A6C0B5S1_9ZZZZ